MNRLSKKHFWEWFSRNNKEYLDFPNKNKKDQAYWHYEFIAHLRAYFKCLGYCLEFKLQEPARLIITVYGKAANFKKADALVAKAPNIPGWTIISLEDPKPIDFMLEDLIQESGIDPRELWFSIDGEGYYMQLYVYHILCSDENEDIICHVAREAIYNLVGERVFGNLVNNIEVANLSQAPADIKCLESLPGCLKDRSSMVIDEKGNLVMGNI